MGQLERGTQLNVFEYRCSLGDLKFANHFVFDLNWAATGLVDRNDEAIRLGCVQCQLAEKVGPSLDDHAHEATRKL